VCAVWAPLRRVKIEVSPRESFACYICGKFAHCGQIDVLPWQCAATPSRCYCCNWCDRSSGCASLWARIYVEHKCSRLSLRPAGAPEAALSARAYYEHTSGCPKPQAASRPISRLGGSARPHRPCSHMPQATESSVTWRMTRGCRARWLSCTSSKLTLPNPDPDQEGAC